jgi:hypothetical protein
MRNEKNQRHLLTNRRNSITRLLAMALASVAITSQASAAPRDWDMNVGGPFMLDATWFEPSRWTGMTVPTAADDVTFGNARANAGPTIVQFFNSNLNPSWPNAVANSLVADSAIAPTPSLNTLTLTLGNFDVPFAGTLTVGSGAFDLGTRINSTVSVSAFLWDISHTSTTNALRIARDGAFARVDIREANLDVGYRLEIGRGFGIADDASVRRSDGEVNLVGLSTDVVQLDVADFTIVGTAGGQGTLKAGLYTESNFAKQVYVGIGTTSTPNGILASDGTLEIIETYQSPGAPVANFAQGLQVGVNAGIGNASLFGDITINSDSDNLAMMIGRGAVDDTANGRVVQGSGSVGVGGTNPMIDPLINPLDTPGTRVTGNVFVGVDGGIGSLTFALGSYTQTGDLVVGDLGFNSTIDGYVPSDGLATVGFQAFVNITGDVFVGNNDSFGELDATLDPGDAGGSFFSANYGSIGNNGTGILKVANANFVTFDQLELRPSTGLNLYEDGGRAELGVDSTGSHTSTLSVRLFHANGEGGRFTWDADNFELRDGRIYDWGNAEFVVPEQGRFTGSGEADVVTFRNAGQMYVGYESGGTPTYNDSLTITGDFINSGGALYLDGLLPTRLSLNGEETLVILGDALFDSGTISLEISNDADWYSDIQAGDTFNFFDFSLASQPVDFSNVTVFLPFLPSQWEWNTSLLSTQGVIYVQAIPEPASMAALLAAAGVLLSRHRRI